MQNLTKEFLKFGAIKEIEHYLLKRAQYAVSFVKDTLETAIDRYNHSIENSAHYAVGAVFGKCDEMRGPKVKICDVCVDFRNGNPILKMDGFIECKVGHLGLEFGNVGECPQERYLESLAEVKSVYINCETWEDEIGNTLIYDIDLASLVNEVMDKAKLNDNEFGSFIDGASDYNINFDNLDFDLTLDLDLDTMETSSNDYDSIWVDKNAEVTLYAEFDLTIEFEL